VLLLVDHEDMLIIVWVCFWTPGKQRGAFPPKYAKKRLETYIKVKIIQYFDMNPIASSNIMKFIQYSMDTPGAF